MFDEFHFQNIEKLPTYVFAQISALKNKVKEKGVDVIDFSMGNPDGNTPSFIIDKLCEYARKDNMSGYSDSTGIPALRQALCSWYKNKYGVDLDYQEEVIACMGSKEGFINLIRAIVNPGDIAIVPCPAYPIHKQAFIMAGASVLDLDLKYDEQSWLNDEDFFNKLESLLKESTPKPKYLVVNFPHNPTACVIKKSFYKRLIDIAKKERFYIISDIAYAELCYKDYKTPSILEIEGAKDVAVECYTLSKTYNMAGFRVGFISGNKRLVLALKRLKSWLDYGMYTPIQMAACEALLGDQSCVEEAKELYIRRMDVLCESFKEANWQLSPSKASMFVWAKLPQKAAKLGSMEFSKLALVEAGVALSPGFAFGKNGEGYVRIALIENEERIKKAAQNMKAFLANFH